MVTGAAMTASTLAQAAGGVSPYEPAEHKFDYRLGDGKRITLPEHLFEGQNILDEDRTIELRQITIAENCRCIRLSLKGDEVDWEKAREHAVRACIRKIGSKEGADLGDKEFDQWLSAAGLHGYRYLKALLETLNGPTTSGTAAYEASRRLDIEKRRQSYIIPASLVPAKRWALRTGVEGAKLVEEKAQVKEKGKTVERVVRSYWSVGGQPVDEASSLRLNRDLAFTMQTLSVDLANRAMDLLDDPDDQYATRIMEVMLSIVDIGGSHLGTSPEDLTRKLQWLEDIGPRARLLVAGTFVRLHEVDYVDLARFLDSATPLD